MNLLPPFDPSSQGPDDGPLPPPDWPMPAQRAGQRQALAADIAAIRASASWRLGAPLRRLAQVLRRWRERGTQTGYERWLRQHLQAQAAHPAAGPQGPLLSVIMPVYNPPLRWLEAAIDSVRSQSYANWELCLADDASTEPGVRPLLQRLAASDARIRWVARERNGHISAASNSALALAQGEWMVLLDQDDLLAPQALMRLAQEIATHPQAQLVYSDEDKVDAQGRHYAPYFKPDWNAELLRAQNYVSHLGAYRLSLVRELGGFREGFEGAQDHDLVLRASERLRPQQVRHIPAILYHWRAHRSSTAESGAAKGYAQAAAVRAIEDHLRRLGRAARVSVTPYGFRARPRMPVPVPGVSLLVAWWGGEGALEGTLDALQADMAVAAGCEVLVLDLSGNGGGVASVHRERWPAVQWIAPAAGESPGALGNRAARQAGGALLGWLDAGVEPLEGGWLAELVAQALVPDVGAVGAQIVDAEARIVDGARLLHPEHVACPAFGGALAGDGAAFNRSALAQQFSAVSGACALVRRAAFEAVGGFDDNTLPHEHAFTDLCLRMGQAGWRIVWTPYAECMRRQAHAPRTDEGTQRQAFSEMNQRWHHLLSHDPAHNPNLPWGSLSFDPADPRARTAAAEPLSGTDASS